MARWGVAGGGVEQRPEGDTDVLGGGGEALGDELAEVQGVEGREGDGLTWA
jgi:hypothetical protein